MSHTPHTRAPDFWGREINTGDAVAYSGKSTGLRIAKVHEIAVRPGAGVRLRVRLLAAIGTPYQEHAKAFWWIDPAKCMQIPHRFCGSGDCQACNLLDTEWRGEW